MVLLISLSVKLLPIILLSIWSNTTINSFFQGFLLVTFKFAMVIGLFQDVYFILLEFCSFGFQEMGPLLGTVVVKFFTVFAHYLVNGCRVQSFIPDIGGLCLQVFNFISVSGVLSIILIFWRTWGMSGKSDL